MSASRVIILCSLFVSIWIRKCTPEGGIETFSYNSARPDGIISFEGTLTTEQFDRLKKQWSERHEGVNKAQRVGLLKVVGSIIKSNSMLKTWIPVLCAF